MRYVVEITKSVRKAIDRLPHHVADKLLQWALEVERTGLPAVRRRPGFHDEPLSGRRAGQRSIRLNRSWRAIYVENEEGEALTIVEVQEVTHHDY